MNSKWKRMLLLAVAGLVGLGAVVYVGGLTRPELVEANASIEIAKPPDYVFDLVADPRRQKDWFSGVGTVEILSQQPLRYRISAGGATAEMESTFVDRPKRVVTRSLSHSMGMSGEWETAFEPTAGGTRVTHRARMNFTSPWLRAMTLVVDANKEELSTLEALKRYAESH